jgi:hypothetical protein
MNPPEIPIEPGDRVEYLPRPGQFGTVTRKTRGPSGGWQVLWDGDSYATQAADENLKLVAKARGEQTPK